MDTILQWLENLTFWHWMVLGVILVGVEILAPGIWFLWLGIGALLTGLVTLIYAELSWQLQAVVFSTFSVVSIVIGRIIMRRGKQSEDHPTLNKRAAQYVGQVFVLEEETKLGRGRVRVGDSMWRVQLSDPSVELPGGTKVTVSGVEGATLKVDPEAD